MGSHRHNVIQNPSNLTEHSSDVLGSLWNLNIQQLLYGKRIRLLVAHHGHIVETIKVGKGLEVCLVLDELQARTTVIKTRITELALGHGRSSPGPLQLDAIKIPSQFLGEEGQCEGRHL